MKDKSDDTQENIKDEFDSEQANLQEGFNEVYDSVKDPHEDVFETIKDEPENVYESIKENTEEVYESVNDTAESAYDSVKEEAENIYDDISDDANDSSGNSNNGDSNKADEPVESIASRCIRGLFVLLFLIAMRVAAMLVVVVAVFQFLHVLIAARVNKRALGFGEALGLYMNETVQFTSYNSDTKPWPFSKWPCDNSSTEE